MASSPETHQLAVYDAAKNRLNIPAHDGASLALFRSFMDRLRWRRSPATVSPALNRAWPMVGEESPRSSVGYGFFTNPALGKHYPLAAGQRLQSEFADAPHLVDFLRFSGVVLEVSGIRTVREIGQIARLVLPEHFLEPEDKRLELPDTTGGDYAGIDWDRAALLADPFGHALVVISDRPG